MTHRDDRRPSDAALARERRAEVRPEPIDWFEDEIGVGFPSVDAVLDRIRDAFFGPDAVSLPLPARLVLTPRQAFFGVRVPLQVPIRRTCARCGGRGEVWMDRCHACGGTGDALGHHEVQVSVPPGVRDGAKFRFSVTPPAAPATVVEIRIVVE